MRTLKFVNLRAWILSLMLLSSACSPTTPTAISTSVPAATPTPNVSSTPVSATTPDSNDTLFTYEGIYFTLDPTLVARASGQVIPEKPASTDAPYWEVYPQYIRITLEGYPVTKSAYGPLIAVYPVQDYHRMSEPAGQTLDQLTQFLAEKPVDANKIPALPVRNSLQSFHSNVQYLAFQNGYGVRFLAIYAQYKAPVNNTDLFYTFQGLTSDGRYAVSVILPVNHFKLPTSAEALSQTDYEKVLQDRSIIRTCPVISAPSLAAALPPISPKLDDLVKSLRIEYPLFVNSDWIVYDHHLAAKD